MRFDLLFLVLFVIYCVEAGLFLLVAPWHAGWDRAVVHLPAATLRELLLSPTARGAVSGFGLVHLLWGLHDLRLVLGRRRRRRRRHPAGHLGGDAG